MNKNKSKIVLFFASQYINNESDTLKEIQLNVTYKLRYYTKLTKFTKVEHDFMVRIDPGIKDLLNVELSHQIFGFELLKLWALDTPRKQQPILGISQALLIAGKAHYTKERFQLKLDDLEAYKSVVEIIDFSEKIANDVFNFIKESK